MIDFAGLGTAVAVGTGTRPVSVGDLPEPIATVVGPGTADAADVLLDAAAAWVAARDASVRPGPGLAPLRLAPPSKPAAPAPVVALLRRVRADGTLRDALQHEALIALAGRGLTLPPDLLLELLADSHRHEVARDLAAVLDDRGWALVGLDAAWTDALARSGASREPADPRAWDEGGLAQRTGYLRALRATQPAAARALLETPAFAKEPPDARETFVRALDVGLSADDEPFLEGRLDDRARAVRHAAADVLAGLSGSAYLRRAEDLAARHLQLKSRFLRHAALVAQPVPVTAQTRRDGYPESDAEKTPAERLHLLHVISLVPTDRWPEVLGASAVELATGPAEYHGSPIDLSSAFVAAAHRWRDAELAEALAASRPGLIPGLLAVLPPARRDQLAAEALRSGSDAGLLNQVVSRPMAPALAVAALDAIATLAGGKPQYHRIAELVVPLAVNADPLAAPALVERLRSLEQRLPAEKAAAARRAVGRAAAALQLRQALAEALLPYPVLTAPHTRDELPKEG